jgi:heme-degrading monooxygenase HmoA
MFIVMNRFFVNPDYVEQFETRIRNRPQQVDSQPGFVRAQLLRPDQSGAPHIVLTVWESKAAFEAWVKADTFTETHAGRRTLAPEVFLSPNRVETFTVVLDTDARA